MPAVVRAVVRPTRAALPAHARDQNQKLSTPPRPPLPPPRASTLSERMPASPAAGSRGLPRDESRSAPAAADRPRVAAPRATPAAPRPPLAPRTVPSPATTAAKPSPDGAKPSPDDAKILFQSFFKSVGPRTYAAQLKQAGNGNHFLVLTEGKRDKKTAEVRKTRLFVFSEDFPAFFNLIKETAAFVDAHPVPEEVRRRQSEFWRNAKRGRRRKPNGQAR